MSRNLSISARYSGFITHAERPAFALWATTVSAFRLPLCICFAMMFRPASVQGHSTPTENTAYLTKIAARLQAAQRKLGGDGPRETIVKHAFPPNPLQLFQPKATCAPPASRFSGSTGIRRHCTRPSTRASPPAPASSLKIRFSSILCRTAPDQLGRKQYLPRRKVAVQGFRSEGDTLDAFEKCLCCIERQIGDTALYITFLSLNAIATIHFFED